MGVRTFFWEGRRVGRLERLSPVGIPGRRPSDAAFRTGNAGDLFVRDVIRFVYGTEPVTVQDDGRRLLLIGSIAHTVRDGDVVCGVGSKGVPVPSARDVRCRVLAVRGPITLEAFRTAGHDVSQVASQLDPGLLLRLMLPDAAPRRGRRIFIPHYRERSTYRDARERHGLDLVSIDDEPLALGRRIQEAEVVYTSSLHGMVFAHALRRPAVLVAPRTAEADLKYRDYLASVGMGWPGMPDLAEALRAPAPDHGPDLDLRLEDFALPTLARLREDGIAD